MGLPCGCQFYRVTETLRAEPETSDPSVGLRDPFPTVMHSLPSKISQKPVSATLEARSSIKLTAVLGLDLPNSFK